MKLLRKFFPATAAAALTAAMLVAAPQSAHAQWWVMDPWYGTGVLNDFDYYEDYGGYYETNLLGDDWVDWW